MVNSVVASLALFGASAVASSVGSATVVNKCNYDVTLCNVPAEGGGYSQEDKTLAAGESWNQAWTSLSNGNGWSIKLSKSESLENILQYEYTFHNDGIIWYDLSCVNGNPWDQDWEITAKNAECNPKQQAYRYATDDAYGMQSCPSEADITVTLCTGVSADDGNSTDSGSSAPSYDSPASSASAPSYQSSSASPPSYQSASSKSAPAYKAPKATPTTFSTSTTAVVTEDPAGITVTEVVTAYATNIVTAYAGRRRHDHGHHGHHHDA